MDHGGPYFWRTGDERRADAGLNDSSLSDDLVEIGERLRKRRIYLHLSQEQLAEKAKISVNTVSRIECGQAAMSIDKFVRILRALKADANEMIGPRILEEAGSKSTESLFIRFRHAKPGDMIKYTFIITNTGSDILHDVVLKGKEIASHKDVNDEKQTVHAPAVETNAEDGLTEDHTGTVSEKSIVRDIVTCRNLVIGKEYTVTGTLMDKATGKNISDKSGNPVSAEKTFKAEKKDDEITLEFSVDSSLLEGKTVVAFEDLYHGEVKVAVHADISDEEQSVHYPRIRTNAVDGTTGGKTGPSTQKTTIVDKVSYQNLIPGKEYIVKGVLMNREDGKEVLGKDNKSITASVTFRPEKEAGSVELVYQIEKGLLAGATVVVFEDLYHNDIKVASHADIKDQNQTVSYPDVTTDAKDGSTKDHAGTVAAKASVTDVVTYHKLSAGKKYTVKGVLMDKASGTPLLDAEGKQITSETEFTAEKADGTVELP